MTYDIGITLIIILVGVYLFVREYFSIDTTSIIIMALFIVSGILTPEEGFSGFNNPATITVGSMFVLSAGVFKTGILNGVGKVLMRAGKLHSLLGLGSMMLMAAFLSAFINDTAVVALLMPIVIQVAKDSGLPAGRLLMPLSFSALLGGVCTLIGTSTNLLVSGIIIKSGLEPLGMFEFSQAGLWIMAAGFLYLLSIGLWLIPGRQTTESEKLSGAINEYITEIILTAEAKDANCPINKSALSLSFQARILRITRQGGGSFDAFPETILLAGDVLRIMISPENLQKLRKEKGYLIVNEHRWRSSELETKEDKLIEALIPSGSDFASRSLRQLNFRHFYNAIVLAIRRREGVMVENFSEIPLREGDLLLLLTPPRVMERMQRRNKLISISEYQHQHFTYHKAIPAVLIVAGVVLAAAFNITSITISAVVGALVMVLLNIIKPEEAYGAIEWKVIFMLAGVLSMGTALEKTGGAALLAEGIQELMEGYPPRIVLSFVFLLTFLATNFLSNNATAALMAPIAINIAQSMELSERPFIIAVMFAASLSFITPLGYQTNTMIYAPGNYRFSDYLKVGTPLNLLIWLLASFLIPVYFPFNP
jgi:di/tricarboxylate transporter